MRATKATVIRIGGWCLAGMIAVGLEAAAAVNAAPFALEILWSTPISGAPQPSPGTSGLEQGSGLVLVAGAQLPDGGVLFLGNRLTPKTMSQVLLMDAGHRSPNSAAVLRLAGVPSVRPKGWLDRALGANKPRRQPVVSSVAAGSNGEIWVGGSSNDYMDIASAPHADAYLARIDDIGSPIWEKVYGNGARGIRSLAAAPSGDLAVFGRDGWDGWLAMIAPDGDLVWERHVGSDLGGAVAWAPGDRLVVAGFESSGSGSSNDYQDHVAIWIVDRSGNVLTRTRIRDAINKTPHSYSGEIGMVVAEDAVYVVSNWAGLFDAQPAVISKVSLDGELLWSRALPETIITVKGNVETWRSCSPSLAVGPDGDPMVGCAMDGQIQLYQLDRSSGRYRQSVVPAPACQAAHPAKLFFTVRDNATTLLSGTRPDSNVAANCTWLGRLIAHH